MTRQNLSTTTIRPFKTDVAAARLDVIQDRVRAFRWDVWSEPAERQSAAPDPESDPQAWPPPIGPQP